MKTEVELVIELKARYNDLSNFQALQIACEMRRNGILKAAFTGDNGSGKTTISETISTALGKK